MAIVWPHSKPILKLSDSNSSSVRRFTVGDDLEEFLYRDNETKSSDVEGIISISSCSVVGDVFEFVMFA